MMHGQQNGLLKSLMIHVCKEYKRNSGKNEIARVIHCVTQLCTPPLEK